MTTSHPVQAPVAARAARCIPGHDQYGEKRKRCREEAQREQEQARNVGDGKLKKAKKIVSGVVTSIGSNAGDDAADGIENWLAANISRARGPACCRANAKPARAAGSLRSKSIR
jgi:hypothetical protein